MATIAPLTKRLVKGSPLTSAEGDNNWSTLEDFVNALAEQLGVSLNDDGTLKVPQVVRGASTNGTQDYACTLAGTYATAADLVGKLIVLHVDTASNPTGTTDYPTLTINGTIGPLDIRKFSGGMTTATILPVAGDIRINQECILTYDPVNTCLILHNPTANSRLNFAPSALVGLSSNDYTITLPDLMTYTFEVPQAYYAGHRLSLIAPTSLTSVSPEPTLKIVVTTPSIVALTAKTLKKQTAAGKVSLAVGDMTAGNTYEFIYDGTNFILLNPDADPMVYRSAATAIPATAGAIAGLSGVAHGLGGKPDFCELIYICVASSVNTGSYVVGDEIPFSAAIARNTGGSVCPLATLVQDTAGATFTILKPAAGASPTTIADVLMEVKATGSIITPSHAQFVADWQIKVVLGRYRR